MDDEGQYWAQMQAEAAAHEAEAAMAAEAEYRQEQEYYKSIDIHKQRFLKAFEELIKEHGVEYRCMGGEIDLLGNGWRLTPLGLFEALFQRGL
jgi:hypothetical protein